MIILGSLLFLAGGIALSLLVGATSGFDPQIFWLLRLPRSISAVAVGGGLAVAGSLIQASLGNPLADPYTIGIASAAALGTVVGSLFRINNLAVTGAFAFAFALGALLLLAIWLRKSFRHATEVLLAGVVSGFLFTSLAALLMALADPAEWSSTLVWMMGSLGHLSLTESICALAVMILISIVGWFCWKPLDLLAVDELSAETSGVDVGSLRKKVFILVSLITAVSVASAGVIGFLGLIVPHVLRRIGVRTHWKLIPLSFVCGAGLLLYSDVLARLVARPSEVPAGVIMAILGAPCFLILARSRRIFT